MTHDVQRNALSKIVTNARAALLDIHCLVAIQHPDYTDNHFRIVQEALAALEDMGRHVEAIGAVIAAVRSDLGRAVQSIESIKNGED